MNAIPLAFVYALVDGEGKPRYVGSTTDPKARLKYHWSHRRNPQSPVNTWLSELDEPPGVELLAAVPHDQRLTVEGRLTDLLRESGAPLLNVISGGSTLTGWHHTPEAKARISRSIRETLARKRAERAAAVS